FPRRHPRARRGRVLLARVGDARVGARVPSASARRLDDAVRAARAARELRALAAIARRRVLRRIRFAVLVSRLLADGGRKRTRARPRRGRLRTRRRAPRVRAARDGARGARDGARRRGRRDVAVDDLTSPPRRRGMNLAASSGPRPAVGTLPPACGHSHELYRKEIATWKVTTSA